MTEPEDYRAFVHIIGIDPGPTPGIVMLTPRGFGRHLEIDVVQCTARVAPAVLFGLLDQCRMSLGDGPALVQIEEFVVGRASMRSAAAGSVTRRQIGQLQAHALDQPNVRVITRNASTVKLWATDERLEAAGLLEATKGMRHARDAARHALFAAVRDAGFTDPLSRKAVQV